MSYDIPHHWDPKIEEIAHAQHITAGEALERIMQAGVEQIQPSQTSNPPVSYVSLFGAAKGPGTLGSREAVERYLAELRNE